MKKLLLPIQFLTPLIRTLCRELRVRAPGIGPVWPVDAGLGPRERQRERGIEREREREG